MKQVVQNYRTGELKLIEAPAPLARPGGVLVRNVNSVVSVGTEKQMMDFARKSLLGKALARRDLTQQVIELAKNEGLVNAYRQATNRLDTLTPLGYSSAGVIVEVGANVHDFRVGDRVACARSGFASHAECVFVPKNLCASIPDDVDFESAAFCTVGAISLHAVRLCELSLGENIAIIGLGLLGQFAVQIAKASGCRVFGVDTNGQKALLAKELGADDCALAGDEDVAVRGRAFSRGGGFDAVVILASAASNQPLDMAAELCREKGKIIAPGMVKLDVPREKFYQKELSLVVSRAWGPGFNDSAFELEGVDYPYGYVRWTERDNMEQFLELVGSGRIKLEPLITHRFKIDEAEKAYSAIMKDASGEYIGVLLSYDVQEKEPLATRIQLKKGAEARKPKEKIGVGLVGAGAFATGTMLPILRKMRSVNLRGVATATGPTGKHAGDKFGFDYCTTDYNELLGDSEIDCVLIATRHNLHARLVKEALACGKDVFVEKPLALSRTELDEVAAAYRESQGRLMVGFNRRFSPFSLRAKELLSDANEPLVINYRVNAGFIPKESWVHDPSEGGGRILGEVCHFIDLAQFLTGARPAKVYAECLRDTGVYGPHDNVLVTMTCQDGSVASIAYVASGDKAFPREKVEIFGGGSVCVIDNFKSLVFTRRGKRKRMRRQNKDSGHRAEFAAFFGAIQRGEDIPVGFEEYAYTTVATSCVEESLSRGTPVEVDLHLHS